MCMLVGLDYTGLHSMHTITRAHCSAITVKGVVSASLKTTLCIQARLAKASSLRRGLRAAGARSGGELGSGLEE